MSTYVMNVVNVGNHVIWITIVVTMTFYIYNFVLLLFFSQHFSGYRLPGHVKWCCRHFLYGQWHWQCFLIEAFRKRDDVFQCIRFILYANCFKVEVISFFFLFFKFHKYVHFFHRERYFFKQFIWLAMSVCVIYLHPNHFICEKVMHKSKCNV